MFTLAEKNMVWWPVDLLARDGEDQKDVTVLFLFEIYKRSELKARERKLTGVIASLSKVEPAAPGADSTAPVQKSVEQILAEAEQLEAKSTQELVDRIHGWKKIARAGVEIPFSRDVLAELLDDEAQYTRISAGLLDASKGARRKNSSPGPAGSRAQAQN